MIKKYCNIFMLLLVMFSACKKENNPQTFTESSYPLAVSDWWQYQLTDIQYGSIDTITLKVISTDQSGPYMKYECDFIYNGNVTDSGYFLQSDTSLSFVTSNAYFVSCFNFHITFPTQTGDKWLGAFPGDTIKVESVVQSYTLGTGNIYGPCYFLGEAYDLPHNSKVEGMILTPKVGLINQSINFNSDTAGKTASYGGGIQMQQSINLISYHVQ